MVSTPLRGAAKTPGAPMLPEFCYQALTPDFDNVLGLEAFGALDYLKLHQLIFLQRAEAFPLDGAVMHKDIRAVFPGNESKTFGVIKPLHLRSEEHTSELQSRLHLVCRPL